MIVVSAITAVHLLAAVIATATTVALLLLPTRLRALVPYLGWASAGTVVWTLCVASVKHEGIHPWHQLLWFPAIAFTTGALLLWARWFVQHGWQAGRRSIVWWLGVPALILAVRLAGGIEVRPALFVANTVYCFALLLAIAVQVSRRAGDRDPDARLLARFILAAAVLTLIAEAFRLNVTDLVATVALVVIVTATVRAGEDVLPRPDAGTLIDDLGALVLVFDDRQRLVDVNAPTRLFYVMRGVEPPAVGVTAVDLLGADLQGLDTLTRSLDVGGETVRLSGYVQRLPSDGTPPGGWVCLLRRSTPAETPDRVGLARRARMSRIPSHDPGTGLLSTRAFLRVLDEAGLGTASATEPAVAVVVASPNPATLADAASLVATAWADRTETVALGRYDATSIGLVLRDVDETAVDAWREDVSQRDDVLVAARSGTVAGATELVRAAAAEVARRPPA